MPVAFDLYDELTQRMDKILEPRYRAMYFENGDLIPTMADLEPGVKELAYPRMEEIGDAAIMGDAASDIPMIQITGDIDRYPIYMIMSAFPVTFQESRMLSRSQIDSFQRRMTAARRAIAQYTNKVTALGLTTLNFPGALTNSLITTDNSAVNIYTSDYQTVLDFFVSIIRSLTDNYVTSTPTDMVVNVDVCSRLISLENAQGTRNVKERLEEIFPELLITETKEMETAQIDGSGITRPGTGKDRIFLYPKEDMVLSRHIEETVAALAPEEYVRTATIKGQLARVYPMFSCVSPAIFDYPDDCRYIDIPAKS